MKTIWICMRSVLAVAAGVVAMTLLTFAFEIPIRAEAVRVLGIFERDFGCEDWVDVEPNALHHSGSGSGRVCGGGARSQKADWACRGDGGPTGVVIRGFDR
jgi:hypothetical protein